MGAMLFAVVGFILFVGSVLVWVKSDNSAFAKACENIQDTKSDILSAVQKTVKDLSEESGKQAAEMRNDLTQWTEATVQMKDVLTKGFEKTTGAIEQLQSKYKAQELEIHHLKIAVKTLQGKLVPRIHELTLKTDSPLKFQLVREAGAKKAKPESGKAKASRIKGH